MIQIKKEENFFDRLTTDNQKLFLTHGTVHHCKKGEFLFREGDKANFTYLITNGRIRLSKTFEGNRTFFFQVKDKHDLVGALSIYTKSCYCSNAEVIEDTTVMKIPNGSLEELFISNREIAVAFMKWLTINSHSIHAQYRDIIFCGKREALFSILIRLCHSYGEVRNSVIFINKQISHSELANYVGVTRESISQMLHELENLNVISSNNRFISVNDIQYLKNELQCDRCSYAKCSL